MTTNQVSVYGYQLNEQLYNGSRTFVYRGFREIDAKPVVVKLMKNHYPSFSELLQFRNQYTIAKNLNLPGIIQTYSLEPYQNGYALVMEDFGGISLKEYFTSYMETLHVTSLHLEFLQIAISLCDTLDILIRNRIIHKDIKPANILINPETKQVKLIDFSISSLLARETQNLMNPNVLEGTLGYLSPEQTGRMNRGIDYRSDFYSLGVTFYELLTGELPFQSDDAMELVHCHIAKQSPLVHKINPEIPIVLSSIIAKLMAKNAENRYQSALGLKYDLETCLQQLKYFGKIESFQIAQRDICEKFIIPEKLYGRKKEVKTLLEAFGRVARPKDIKAYQGNSELMLVAGFSGIGKTVIINEIHKPIVRQRGYFIKGKFDQFNRNIPLSAFVQAFRDLMGQLLSESDTQLSTWRDKILQALGNNGQVIIEVIPELEKIIGQQPPALELSGNAAQNLFNLLFQKFIQVFTTKDHPLVIFLDDLQWADSASLKLMKLLISESEDGYLLLIGAYRDNEVSAAHPLMLSLKEISKSAAIINTITLAPLDEASLNQLVADTLICPVEIALPLTQLVYQKTRGNPFFSAQFLKALYEDGLIQFDLDEGIWQCDISRIKALALTDDVVEFMALQLQKLPYSTQNVLKLAACIGNQFDLATLAVVSEQSESETAANLWKALQEGLILPTSEVYKFYVGRETHDAAFLSEVLSYKFLHDRVQQAAYSLIPEDQKQSTHLKIGQLLLSNTPIEEREEKIFGIVNQFNYGLDATAEETECHQLAQLNLIAGRKAKAATAYEVATRYLNTGIDLLSSNSWQVHYELILALYTEATEVAHLSGEFEQVEQKAETVLKWGRSLLDKVKVYEIRILSCIAQNKLLGALQIGRDVLELLGITFSEKPNQGDIQSELVKTQLNLGDKCIKDLVNLPPMTNPEMLTAMRILAVMFSPAYLAAPELMLLVVFKKVNLSIQHGNADLSAFAYANYGTILCGLVGDIESGYQFGQLALQVLALASTKEQKAKTLYMVNGLVKPWREHIRETVHSFEDAYQSGLETGDLEWASYSAYYHSQHSYFLGKELSSLDREMANYGASLAKMKQETASELNSMFRQCVVNLMGNTVNPFLIVGDIFDARIMLPKFQQANHRTALCKLYLNQLMLTYLFDYYDQAVDTALKTEEHLDGVTGMLIVPTFYFYSSLAQLAVMSNASKFARQPTVDKIAENQEKMKQWASHAPMNFQHKFDLVEAERYRVLSQWVEASELYDKAIAGAKENEYIQEEGLGNELAAKFYLGWGKEKVAQAYMQEAYYCYAHWGAKAKTDDLEKRYPQLLAPILQTKRSRFHLSETRFSTLDASSFLHQSIQTTRSSSTSLSEALDFATILKVSQILSSEIRLEQLVSTLMQVVMENAGAKKAVLLLPKDGNLAIEAITNTDEGLKLLSVPFENSQLIPCMLVNYIKRSLTTVVLDNATIQNDFIADPYLIRVKPKSILCTPILNQGKLIGLLYLENQLTIGVFTHERLEIIQLLCTQAAISLENARLYQESQDYAQQTRDYAKQLEQLLQDLQQTQLQMVQNEKMATLGNLVAGVAHEINNPIGFLTGSINNAEEYIQDLFDHIQSYQQHHHNPVPEVTKHAEEIDLEYLSEDLPKLMGSMRVATERIKDISTSLRTFSRADTAEKVACNIHEGIESTLLILKYRLKPNNKRPAIKVLTEYGKLPLVKCFLGQLNQVFMNILANAIDVFDAACEGKVFAEIQANSQRITILTEFSSDQKTAVIRIKDNGTGMPEDVKERIFDHLFTTKEVGKGTGLGLAIARQIIEETHGGKLSCNSVLNEGTEFVIEIPL
ncbi:MAG: AAA family ATPase [Scytonematopsis contorta HA4267-MV1]|jgi:predicted ATPase/signal transduction histidine kinase|nr:AAA family ATPase [Scytonematopsis contorta HA4267-MV1]